MTLTSLPRNKSQDKVSQSKIYYEEMEWIQWHYVLWIHQKKSAYGISKLFKYLSGWIIYNKLSTEDREIKHGISCTRCCFTPTFQIIPKPKNQPETHVMYFSGCHARRQAGVETSKGSALYGTAFSDQWLWVGLSEWKLYDLEVILLPTFCYRITKDCTK